MTQNVEMQKSYMVTYSLKSKMLLNENQYITETLQQFMYCIYLLLLDVSMLINCCWGIEGSSSEASYYLILTLANLCQSRLSNGKQKILILAEKQNQCFSINISWSLWKVNGEGRVTSDDGSEGLWSRTENVDKHHHVQMKERFQAPREPVKCGWTVCDEQISLVWD